MENEGKKDAKNAVSEFIKKYDKVLVALGALGVGAACVLDPEVGTTLAPILASVGVANTILSFGRNAKPEKAMAGVAGNAELITDEEPQKMFDHSPAAMRATMPGILLGNADLPPTETGRSVVRNEPVYTMFGGVAEDDRASARYAELVRTAAGRRSEGFAKDYLRGCADRDICYDLGFKTLWNAASGNILQDNKCEYTM